VNWRFCSHFSAEPLLEIFGTGGHRPAFALDRHSTFGPTLCDGHRLAEVPGDGGLADNELIRLSGCFTCLLGSFCFYCASLGRPSLLKLSSFSRLEVGEQVLREHSQNEESGHAVVDLQFADALGFIDVPECAGSLHLQFVLGQHATRDREQSGSSRQ
jgi:hypothetical protein